MSAGERRDLVLSRRRAIASLGAGMAALLTGCSSVFGREPDGGLGDGEVEGSVIVVGAGPAGMTAAHLLQQRGADVLVLEASTTHGGRIANDLTFADFPISLGGEWIHVDRSVLRDIVADDSVDIETETVGYTQADILTAWDRDARLTTEPLVTPDLTFVRSSWLDFFTTHLLPGIAPLITYDTVIERIEYGDAGVVLTDADGVEHRADRVVVTVPLKILQLGLVRFDPPLPDRHTSAIAEAEVWSGFKAFVECRDRFYSAMMAPPDAETSAGQRYFYDAAHGRDTDLHVLGVFAVGAQAERYIDAGDAAIDLILGDLDEVFDGAASASYLRHITQNWNEQPFARAAYLADEVDADISRALAEPIADRVFFAGDAYTTFDDWSSVHAAVWSARDAVRSMLN